MFAENIFTYPNKIFYVHYARIKYYSTLYVHSVFMIHNYSNKKSPTIMVGGVVLQKLMS